MTPRKKPKRVYPQLNGRIDRYDYDLPLTIGVVADTHIFEGGGSRTLSGQVLDLFRRFGVDLIVHAGDIVVQSVLDRLTTVAPTIAVFGNNEPIELWKELPERIVLSAGPHRIGIVHGHGGATARSTALTAFEEPVELVIYGHSHIPMIEEIDSVTYFNPGSLPTGAGRGISIGIVTISDRGIRPELILFDAPAHLDSIGPERVPGDSE